MSDRRDPWRNPPRMNRRPIIAGLLVSAPLWGLLFLMAWALL